MIISHAKIPPAGRQVWPLKNNYNHMKKLPLLFFIFLGCNIIPPEPSDFTIEEVTVVGGPNQNLQDSVGLLLVVRGLPPTNKWNGK
jgi:hypothetical protein